MTPNTLSPGHPVVLLEECIRWLRTPSLNLAPHAASEDYRRGLIHLLACLQRSSYLSPAVEEAAQLPDYNLLVYGDGDASLLQKQRQDEGFITLRTHAPDDHLPRDQVDGIVYTTVRLTQRSILTCARIRDEWTADYPLPTFLLYDVAAESLTSLQWEATRRAIHLLSGHAPNLSALVLMQVHLQHTRLGLFVDRLVAQLYESVAPRSTSFLQRLNTAIEAHLTEAEFRVKTLCRELHYSRSQLGRKVRQATGLSVCRYINRYRLEKSCGLLKTTEESIGGIAAEVGFGTQQYFSALFRKEYGCSPSTYRRRARGSKTTR